MKDGDKEKNYFCANKLKASKCASDTAAKDCGKKSRRFSTQSLPIYV